jgi:hypothetical protein
MYLKSTSNKEKKKTKYLLLVLPLRSLCFRNKIKRSLSVKNVTKDSKTNNSKIKSL